MSQIISAFNSYSATKIYLPCPYCGKQHELSLPAFIVAINGMSDVKCVHCNKDFMIMLICLRRQPEQSNDAETGIPEALCDDVEHDFLKSMGDKFCGNCGKPRSFMNARSAYRRA